MKKYLLIFIGLLLLSCSEDSSPTETNGNNNIDENGNETPVIDITGQWDFSQSISNKYSSNKNKNQHSKAFKTSSDSLDLGILSIDSPVTGELTDSEIVSVTIANFGTNDLADFDLSYTLNGGEAITETFTASIEAGSTAQHSFSSSADLSTLGTYTVEATTLLASDQDTSNDHLAKEVTSLNFTDLCTIHSIIFNEDDSFNLYTLNEEGICNYVLFGTYTHNQEEATVTLYISYEDDTSLVLGIIHDVQVDNGVLSGTFNFDDLCVQVVDGYEEAAYTEGLTYIPDDNLEAYLISIGVDDVMDNYILSSKADNVSSIGIEATNLGMDENGDNIWTDRLQNLAGIEAFPNLFHLQLIGNDLDSINISQNAKLENFYANFNQFKKVDTSGNPLLHTISIDGNASNVELDFSHNPNLVNLSIPTCDIVSLDLSNNNYIEFLDLYNNHLTSLDVSNMPNLREVRLHWNDVTSIDVSNNPLLEELIMPGNDLQGTLDVSACENLLMLNVSMNPDLTCIKVNEDQLSNLTNPLYEWEYGDDVIISLDCN
jgi:hypothetical protein